MRIEKRVHGILRKGLFSSEPPLDPPEYKSEYLEGTWAIMYTPEIIALDEDARQDFEEQIIEDIEIEVGDAIYPADKVVVEWEGEKGEVDLYYIGVTLDGQYGDADLERFGEAIWRVLNEKMKSKGIASGGRAD